jgi:transglutaminase-like putative cysteine protease
LAGFIRTVESLGKELISVRFNMRLRWFLSILVLITALTVPPSDLRAYSDVAQDAWEYKAIESLSEKGILAGYPDFSFRPQQGITRAEFAKVACLAFNLDLQNPPDSRFPDVPPPFWAFPFIEACARERIILGFPDGTFRPQDPISKEQMVAVIVRMIWQEDLFFPSEASFTDVSPTRWSFGCIETAIVVPLFLADEIPIVRNGEFHPQQPATRAEVSVIVWRAERIYQEIWLGPAQQYTLDYSVALTNEDGPDVTAVTFTLPLLQSVLPYQIVESWQSSVPAKESFSDNVGNRFTRFELGEIPTGQTVTVSVQYRVSLRPFVSHLQGFDSFAGYDTTSVLYKQYTQPEQWEESDSSEIQDKAYELAGAEDNPGQAARRIYDFVGSYLNYSGYNPGEKGALAAFRSGEGDCTEFADLFIALCRARGIPARFLEGFTYVSGASSHGDLTHDWAEILLPNEQWLPVDPTFGRFGENYFGATDDRHFLLVRGRQWPELKGFHYYYYQYWWDGTEQPNLDSNEEILIQPIS